MYMVISCSTLYLSLDAEEGDKLSWLDTDEKRDATVMTRLIRPKQEAATFAEIEFIRVFFSS